MIDIISNLGIIIIIGVVAFFAGMFGDLEADVSPENPNSHILHAPEKGKLHKLFTKVVSSTSVLITAMATISGAFTQIFIQLNLPIIVILILAPLITTVIHVIIMATSYMAQMTGCALYDQPLYVDVLYNNVPTIASYSFICLFSLTFISYLIVYHLTPALYLSMPILTFILGILLGCITSIIGDIYFGAGVLYQHRKHEFEGEIKQTYDITTHEAIVSRNSIDILYLTSKFSGPATGLCFGLIIFLIFWIFILYGTYYGLIVGVILCVVAFIINYILDIKAHKKYDKHHKTNKGD